MRALAEYYVARSAVHFCSLDGLIGVRRTIRENSDVRKSAHQTRSPTTSSTGSEFVEEAPHGHHWQPRLHPQMETHGRCTAKWTRPPTARACRAPPRRC